MNASQIERFVQEAWNLTKDLAHESELHGLAQGKRLCQRTQTKHLQAQRAAYRALKAHLISLLPPTSFVPANTVYRADHAND